MSVRIYVRHDVTDYAAWRKVYDAFDAKRRKMGVTGQAVYRSIDDANDVTVTHDFTNAEKAKAFASSPELKEAMEKAGVKGTPQALLSGSPLGDAPGSEDHFEVERGTELLSRVLAA